MGPVFFVSLLLVVGVTLVGWAIIAYVPPGAWPSRRFMYGALGLFVGAEVLSFVGLLVITHTANNILLYETMSLAYICFLLWWLLANSQRLNLHWQVAKMISPGPPVLCTEPQIVALLSKFSYEYPKRPLYVVRTKTPKRIDVVSGRRVVITVALLVDVDTFFGQLGRSFIGERCWPTDSHAMQAVLLAWLPDKARWKLESCRESPVR
jgi:hypothetical protein